MPPTEKQTHSPMPWTLATIPASGTGGDAASFIPQLREVYRDKSKLLHPDDAQLIVTAVNERPALLQKVAKLEEALGELLFAVENADETGYVDGVGFIKGFDQLNDKCTALLPNPPQP